MSDTFKLFRLQQIDSQLDAIKNRLNEIELALSDQRELKLAESRYAAATESLDQVTAELRLAEGEVKAQRLKIEQTEATLYGGKVRNPKELQDLQNESAALKRYLAVLEDRQLEKMIAQEEAQADEAEASRRLEDEHRHRESLHEALSRERSSLQDDARRQQSEREATAASILKSDMDLYNQLRKQRRGIAVAKVSDIHCSACGSTLNSALLHSSRSPNQISRCDTCGRILYAG